jgi:hypothetical protein
MENNILSIIALPLLLIIKYDYYLMIGCIRKIVMK